MKEFWFYTISFPLSMALRELHRLHENYILDNLFIAHGHRETQIYECIKLAPPPHQRQMNYNLDKY